MTNPPLPTTNSIKQMHFNSCGSNHGLRPGNIQTSTTKGNETQPNKQQQQLTVQENPSLVRPVPAEKYDQYPPTNETTQNISKRQSPSLKEMSKSRNDSLHLCTLNTRTLRTPESLQELELALINIKRDILGISEMRRNGEGRRRKKGVHYVLQGQNCRPPWSVGFVIKTKLKNRIKEFEGISDRIAVLHMSIPNYKKDWSIVQLYATMEQADKNDLESFYNNLSKIARKYSDNHLVIMGDFNAQVGKRESKEEFIMGNFGHGKRSTNGHKLIGFLLEKQFNVTEFCL